MHCTSCDVWVACACIGVRTVAVFWENVFFFGESASYMTCFCTFSVTYTIGALYGRNNETLEKAIMI